jgi:RsiW-degrading membrane proteinase PrsW (M82 family)
MSFEAFSLFLMSLAPALLVLWYVRTRLGSHLPATGPFDTTALLYGGLAAFLAWTLFTVLERVGGLRELGLVGQGDVPLWQVYGVMAPVEELMKMALAIAAGALGSRSSAARALLIAASVGVGFAVYENYSMGVWQGSPVGLPLVTRPVAHLLFGLMAGVGLSLAQDRRGMRRWAAVLGTFAGVSFFHGIYNHGVLADSWWQKTGQAGLVALTAIALVTWRVRRIGAVQSAALQSLPVASPRP